MFNPDAYPVGATLSLEPALPYLNSGGWAIQPIEIPGQQFQYEKIILPPNEGQSEEVARTQYDLYQVDTTDNTTIEIAGADTYFPLSQLFILREKVDINTLTIEQDEDYDLTTMVESMGTKYVQMKKLPDYHNVYSESRRDLVNHLPANIKPDWLVVADEKYVPDGYRVNNSLSNEEGRTVYEMIPVRPKIEVTL